MGERSELICSIKISVVTGIPSGRKSHVRIEREPRQGAGSCTLR